FLRGSGLVRVLLSFPTRRSSDLCDLTVHFPRAYVSLIRTTHLLERFHKEIRRKQRDIGMLQSAAGGDVLWYMVAMRETAKQRASDRKSTRLNSSHDQTSYAVFCL